MEDWGHGEGQGQERGGSVLATSWTPGDPQHHSRGGEEGRRSQARESTLGRAANRAGKGDLEVKALLGAVCWGQGERTPHLKQGRTGRQECSPSYLISLCDSLKQFLNPRP